MGKIVQIPKMDPAPTLGSTGQPSVRKSWPDQKYIVNLPTAAEMEALRRRRSASGGPGAAAPPAEKQAPAPAKQAKPVKQPEVVLSQAEQAAMRAAKVETKGDSTVKMPTAEAIAMLQKRRAAAAAAAAASKQAGNAPGKPQPVDVCAQARERTLKAKAAANLNKAAPPCSKGRTEVEGQDVLASFVRKSSALAAVVAAQPIMTEAERKAKEAEAEKLRKARAEAARQDHKSGSLKAGGVTVKVPTAEAIQQLKERREKATVASKKHGLGIQSSMGKKSKLV